MPASGGLRELAARKSDVRKSVTTIGGIASCISEDAALITSTQCLFAALSHAETEAEASAIEELLRSHQNRTGWFVETPSNGRMAYRDV